MTKHTEAFMLACGHTKGMPWTAHAKPGDSTKCFACPPKIDIGKGSRTAPNQVIERKL